MSQIKSKTHIQLHFHDISIYVRQKLVKFLKRKVTELAASSPYQKNLRARAASLPVLYIICGVIDGDDLNWNPVVVPSPPTCDIL